MLLVFAEPMLQQTSSALLQCVALCWFAEA